MFFDNKIDSFSYENFSCSSCNLFHVIVVMIIMGIKMMKMTITTMMMTWTHTTPVPSYSSPWFLPWPACWQELVASLGNRGWTVYIVYSVYSQNSLFCLYSVYCTYSVNSVYSTTFCNNGTLYTVSAVKVFTVCPGSMTLSVKCVQSVVCTFCTVCTVCTFWKVCTLCTIFAMLTVFTSCTVCTEYTASIEITFVWIFLVEQPVSYFPKGWRLRDNLPDGWRGRGNLPDGWRERADLTGSGHVLDLLGQCAVDKSHGAVFIM